MPLIFTTHFTTTTYLPLRYVKTAEGGKRDWVCVQTPLLETSSEITLTINNAVWLSSPSYAMICPQNSHRAAGTQPHLPRRLSSLGLHHPFPLSGHEAHQLWQRGSMEITLNGSRDSTQLGFEVGNWNLIM